MKRYKAYFYMSAESEKNADEILKSWSNEDFRDSMFYEVEEDDEI